MIAKKKAVKSDIPNLAELLSVMSFYQQVDTDIATPVLLKYSGFKIKGLQGRKQGNSASQWTSRHTLAWHDYLGVGICLCGWKGTEGWSEVMTNIQHQIHTRRAIDKTH